MDWYFATVECRLQRCFTERVQLGQIAAIYCRVSTNDQDCARQETDLIAFSAKAGDEVEGEWKESASGIKADCQQCQPQLGLSKNTVLRNGQT